MLWSNNFFTKINGKVNMCRNGIIGCRNCIAKRKNKSILQRRSDRQITSNSKRTSNNKKKDQILEKHQIAEEEPL